MLVASVYECVPVCAFACTLVYWIRQIAKTKMHLKEALEKYTFEGRRRNISCHGNRVMQVLNFKSIIAEIGSNIMLRRSGNVRTEKKNVSCISVSLVFAEAWLLSEVCCGLDTRLVKKY